MSFANNFKDPEYADSPHLSDQMLLPNLLDGHEIRIVSAFVPSYLFRLLRDLASTPEIEPGELFLNFYLAGDLTIKSEAIARFRRYLCAYAEDEVQVAQFVEDAIQLIDEGGLSLSSLHGGNPRSFTRSCLGVVTPSDPNDDTGDFVGFVDAKGGDFNSPVSPKKSWQDEDYFEAQSILEKVIEMYSGNKGLLISTDEMLEWLELVSDWYRNNPPVPQQLPEITLEGLLDVPEDDEFYKYLKSRPDFVGENRLTYEKEALEEFFDWDEWLLKGFKAEVLPEEAVYGHIPPITNSAAVFLGSAKSECICGKVFTRIYGCPRGPWGE